MKRLLLLLVLLLVIGTNISNDLNAQTDSEHYAYLLTNSDGSATIRTVNPDDPGQATNLVSIPVGASEVVLNWGYLSPDSEWVLIALNTPSNPFGEASLRLFNLRSAEMIEVAQNFRFPIRPNTLGGDRDPQIFGWSPNSRYFAISYGTYESDSQGIYLYDVYTRTLTNLTPLGTSHYRISWSNDSAQLATTGFVCDSGDCSKVAVDIFDVVTGSLNTSIDVSVLSSGPGGQQTNFCELQWSPDDAYLSFVANCDASFTVTNVEAYVIQVNNLSFEQTTSLFPTNVNPSELLFEANYETAWLSNNELLIGTVTQEASLTFSQGVFSSTPGPFNTRTFLYNAQTRTLEQVSNKRLNEWAIANSFVGYVVYEYPLNPTYGDLPIAASAEITTFDGQGFSLVTSGPPGCQLAWNSSGDILAYVREDHPLEISVCSSGDVIQFVDATDGTITTHNSVDGPVLVLGWVTLVSNESPTADAGLDQTLTDTDSNGSELVTLDGSGSFDPDGTIVSYSWTENGVEIATGVSPQVDLAVGVHTITLTVTDDDDATATDDVTITVMEGPTTSELAPFVVFGLEGVHLEQNATVVSGDVGANIASSGPFLAQGSEVTVGIGVDFLDPASRVLGDSVSVRQNAQVYDVYFNEIGGQGQILGQQFTPLSLPLVGTLPTVPSFTAGSQSFDVLQGESLTLDGGSYALLQSRQGATITFTGGVYNFDEWDLGMNTQVYFAAPTEIRIVNRLRVEEGGYVGPANETDLDATDIVIYVTGQNGNNGNLGATPKAAHFGLSSTVIANVYAPNGTLWIRQGSTARGAFIGRWVDIGIGVEVTLESGF